MDCAVAFPRCESSTAACDGSGHGDFGENVATITVFLFASSAPPRLHLSCTPQAQFSAGWTDGTYDAVQAAVASILQTLSDKTWRQCVVIRWAYGILASTHLPRRRTPDQGIDCRSTRGSHTIFYLKKKRDRGSTGPLHELEGDFWTASKKNDSVPTMGNLLMFD